MQAVVPMVVNRYGGKMKLVSTLRQKGPLLFRSYLIILFGAFLYSIGLRMFILPNGLFDNGTTGIGVMIHYLTHLPLGALFIVLNIPFFIIGYILIGRAYFIFTVLALGTLSVCTELLQIFMKNRISYLTDDILLASIFGGILLGLGVGLIIKNGGALDGIETLSIIFARRFGFTIGEIAFFMNIFILFVGGLVFSIDRFMYSLISYFVSMKVLDFTLFGFNTLKNLIIISEKSDEISRHITNELGKGITFLSGKGGYSGKDKNIIYAVVTRFEMPKIRMIVNQIDESAFVVINDVQEVSGGWMKRGRHSSHS
jgi:uncharacterized membrane-anchored protein YitT (DUF2179 family)